MRKKNLFFIGIFIIAINGMLLGQIGEEEYIDAWGTVHDQLNYITKFGINDHNERVLLEKSLIYELNDKIGFGTTSPICNLHISDNMQNQYDFIGMSITSFNQNNTYFMGIYGYDPNYLAFGYYGGAYNRALLLNENEVRLPLNSNLNLDNGLIISGRFENSPVDFRIESRANSSAKTVMNISHDGIVTVLDKLISPKINIAFGAQDGYVLKSDANGNGIWQELNAASSLQYAYNGESGNGSGREIEVEESLPVKLSPPDQNEVYTLLSVGGRIHTQEILVSETAGADFVFMEDYHLRDIFDLEKYIDQNKHLPGIPSATKMINNGVNIGEFQIQLLQKIEELTLYVIELKKENEELNSRINELKID